MGALFLACGLRSSGFVFIRPFRGAIFLSSSSYRATILPDQGPTLMTSGNLKYLSKAPSLNTVTLGVSIGLQYMTLGEILFNP